MTAPTIDNSVARAAVRDEQVYQGSAYGRRQADYYRARNARFDERDAQRNVEMSKQVIFENDIDRRMDALEGLLEAIKGKLVRIEELMTAAPPASTGQVDGGRDSFPAISLSATVDDGKVYWKVKGGRFTKFGASIWPEVLALTDFAEADPLKAHDLTGYTADFVEDEKGTPKVVALYRVGQARATHAAVPANRPEGEDEHWRRECETAVNAFDFDTAMRTLEPSYPDANGVKWAREECFGEAFDPAKAKALTEAMLAYAKKRKALNGSVSKVESHGAAMTEAVTVFNRAK